MDERLQGRRIVVTGATGMAAAGAIRFAAEGAEVFAISLDRTDGDALAARIISSGGRAAAAMADLRDEEATVAAFAAAADALGGIDGVFAVAGASGRRAGDGVVHDVPLAGWDATLALNATPAFLATRQGIRAMLLGGTGGSIVLVSTVLATRPSPERFGSHAYAAAKGAIEALTVTAAATYARDGIRFNAIAPGLVDTPMAARAAADPDIVAYAGRRQPLAGGMLPAEATAGTAAYLLSDDARYVTGQVIAVDGGWSVTSTS